MEIDGNIVTQLGTSVDPSKQKLRKKRNLQMKMQMILLKKIKRKTNMKLKI